MPGGSRCGRHADTRRSSGRLYAAFNVLDRAPEPIDADAGPMAWPWPEPVLTYENALMPHALIVAGGRLGRPALIAAVWPYSIGSSPSSWATAASSRQSATAAGGPGPAGEAGLTSSRSSGDDGVGPRPRLLARLESAATCGPPNRPTAGSWATTTSVSRSPTRSTAHAATVLRGGLNVNQGAESPLMWLTALETIRGLRRGPAAATKPRLEGMQG